MENKKRVFALFLIPLLLIALCSIPVYASCDYDGMCEAGESPLDCSQDCISSQYCGDDNCQSTNNEDCNTCSQDCGLCDNEACNQNLDCQNQNCILDCAQGYKICKLGTSPLCCTDLDCDDSNPQTQDSCSGGQCIHSDLCPGPNDYWDGSQCICDGGYLDCDGNPATGCEVQLGTASNCLSCNDNCNDNKPCTTDSCSASGCIRTDTCPSGKTCTDTGCSSCTSDSQCTSPPNSECYITPGICSSGECSYPPNIGATCNDLNSCTINDQCQANGNCAGTPTETTETICNDGLDNDCDSLVDCSDPDCSNNPNCQTCTDQCSQAEKQCSDNFQYQLCQLVGQCYEWGSLISCPTDEYCLNGNCVECLDGNTLDCLNQFGVCKGSAITCQNNQWPECDYSSNAPQDYQSAETKCNDVLDNDCDGVTDCAETYCKQNEPSCQCNPEETEPCYSGTSVTAEIGVCKRGTRTCSESGSWEGCLGEITPSTEICDMLDNDCDGIIDEDFDIDGDGFTICGGDCDDQEKTINPGAQEKCDGIDSNCNSITDINEDINGNALCECSFIKEALKINQILISSPSTGQIKAIGELIPFSAKPNQYIDSYQWDFGDNTNANDPNPAHSYSSKGIFSVSLTAWYQGCSGTDSISIEITGCNSDDECSLNQECRNSQCIDKQAPANETQTTINIISPESKVYNQNTIPLKYSTIPPGIACSYSLNKDASFTVIQASAKTITAKEGYDILKIKCNGEIASVKFRVKTNPNDRNIFDEFKGNESNENIFDYLRDRGIEQKLSEEEARNLFIAVSENYNFSVTRLAEVKGNTSLILINVKNTLPLTTYFMGIVLKIPKNIAGMAEEIRTEQDHEVIENDPILKFIFQKLSPGEIASIKFIVEKPVDEAMLESISVETRLDMEALLAKQRETEDAIKISRQFEEYEKDGEKYTRIKLRINPKKELSDLSIYEKIPKCLAKHIDDIQMDEKHRQAIKVLNPDPLVMWQFDKMASEKEFSYEVKGVLSEECKKQISAMGIADELGLDLEGGSLFSIILPLLLIPIIGMGVWFVEKRGPPEPRQEMPEKVKSVPPFEPVGKESFEDRLDGEIMEIEKRLNEKNKKEK